MNGLSRFVTFGVAEGRERLARLTAHEPPADDELVEVLEGSSAVGTIARGLDLLSAAARNSRLLRVAAGARCEWTRQPLLDRTRGAGVALIVAAVVNLALVFWHGPMPGWLWLVVPALALAFGVLMALAPSRGLAPGEQR